MRNRTIWTSTGPDQWLVGPVATPHTRLRLLCIPYAGGGPSVFRPWEALVPPHVELRVAQLPGRESRYGQTPLERSAEIVRSLVDALRALPSMPLLIFGHSMGALLAYELAQYLSTECRQTPALLAVSGRSAPFAVSHSSPTPDPDADDFATELAERYQGFSPQVLQNNELMALFLPVLQADFRLVRNHTSRAYPPLPCPVIVLSGNADPGLPVSAMQDWQRWAGAAFSTHVFTGGHFYLRDHAADIIKTLLAAAPLKEEY